MSKIKKLQHYIQAFRKIKVDTNTVRGKAPHKPILLLSILEGILQGEITSPQIRITPNLISVFKKNWSLLVTTTHDINFALPFYHLKTSSFWNLKAYHGFENALSGQVKSLKRLSEAVEYAELEKELFEYAQNSEDCWTLMEVLLDFYFSQTKAKFKKGGGKKYLIEIENQMLHDPPTIYRKKTKIVNQEEVFVRNRLFRKLITEVYNFTCCISGLQVSTAHRQVSMIDACHIVPFHESHNDTITNGIPLCPNLHRAFDKGLITISDQYQVVVSESFGENVVSPYGIRQFHGQKIHLPQEKEYYPYPSALQWHRKNVFEK